VESKQFSELSRARDAMKIALIPKNTAPNKAENLNRGLQAARA